MWWGEGEVYRETPSFCYDDSVVDDDVDVE